MVQLPPLPPFPKSKYSLNRQCVAVRGKGWGVLICVGDHILQEFNSLFLTRFRTYKIALPPQQKPWRGGGLRQINTCCKVSLQVIFLDDDILHCFLLRLNHSLPRKSCTTSHSRPLMYTCSLFSKHITFCIPNLTYRRKIQQS